MMKTIEIKEQTGMKYVCSNCKKRIEKYATFSGNRCLKCYEKDYDNLSEKDKKPNFINTINISK